MNAKILESTVKGILLYNYARCSTIHTAKEQYFFNWVPKRPKPRKALYQKRPFTTKTKFSIGSIHA